MKSYNHGDNKKLVAALYSECKAKKNIIELFHDHNIEVWELKDTDTSVEIVKHEVKRDDFERWLDENITYSKGAKMSLKDLCSLYFDYKKVGVIKKAKFKKEIETFIQKTYPNVNHLCQKTTIDKVSFQGWFDFCKTMNVGNVHKQLD